MVQSGDAGKCFTWYSYLITATAYHHACTPTFTPPHQWRSHHSMFLQQIDLTTALRPSLLPEEILLFVQDAVGLYEGRFKLPEYQNGHAYLTSHRACYVDNEEPRKKAVAINLKDVDRCELYVRVL